MKTWLFAAVAAVLALMPSVAAAQGLTDREVTVVLTQAGLEPQYNPSEDNTHWTGTISMTDEGTISVVVAPYDCVAETGRCQAFTIYANFNTPGGVPAALREAINTFNDSHLRGRAYALSEAVGVDFLIIVDGDTGADYLARRIGEFGKIASDFVAQMREAS